MTREELATEVAAWEAGKPPDQVTDEERREALISLHHRHLPMLEQVGLVSRSENGESVAVDQHGIWNAGLPDLTVPPADSEQSPEWGAFADPARRALVNILRSIPPTDFPLPIEAIAGALLVYDRPASRPVGPDREYDRVLVSLHHRHLPKLADAGVIDYDREEQTVRFTGG